MREYISTRQLACFTIGFTLGSSLVFKAGVEYAGRATWVSHLISAGLGLLIVLMISYLVKNHPSQDLHSLLTSLIGPVPAKIFILYYIFFAILLAALVAKAIEDLITTSVMTETPNWIFSITLVFSTGFIVRKGVEVTARCCEIVVPLVVFVLSILFLAGFWHIDSANLLPVFSVNLPDFTKAVIINLSFPTAEIFLLASLALHVKKPDKLLRSFLPGFLIGVLFLVLRSVLSVGIFSAHEAADLIFPVYTVAKVLRFGNYVERIELFFLFTWFFVIFIKTAVCIFAAAKEVSSLFGLKDYKTIVYPLCILIVPLSINAYGSYLDINDYNKLVLPLMVLPVCFFFLPLFVFISLLKKQSGQKRTAKRANTP